MSAESVKEDLTPEVVQVFAGEMFPAAEHALQALAGLTHFTREAGLPNPVTPEQRARLCEALAAV